MDRYALLENPPAGMEPLARLWDWAQNESWERGDAWRAFLDLTGYSRDNYGDTVNAAGYSPGYLELSKLAAALAVFADRPGPCRMFMLELELAE